MEYYLVGLIGIAFGIFVIVKESMSIRRKSSIFLIHIFNYMYGITYGFFPACVLIAYASTGIVLSCGYYRIDYSSCGLNQILIWMILSFLGFFVVQCSYKLFYAHQYCAAERRLSMKKGVNSSEGDKENIDKIMSKLQSAMLICFVISSVSLYLWTRAYGGVWGLIMIADQVRDGIASVRNSVAFFARPAKMILISSYMALVLVRNRYNTGINIIFMTVSFVLSLLMLIALDGRLGMAFFIATVLFLTQDISKIGAFSALKKKKIIAIVLIALICIFNMDAVTFFIRNGYWKAQTSTKSLFEKVFTEFTYIFAGAQHSVGKMIEGECPYLIGDDIKAGVFSWIPTSLRPDGIVNIWNYNTALCTIGGKAYGQLPCDFITTSVYAVGMFGPLVYGIFYGLIIKRLDLWHVKSANPVSDIFYCVIAMRIFRLVNYCLLYDFILGFFSIVLAALIWWICKHTRIRERGGVQIQ